MDLPRGLRLVIHLLAAWPLLALAAPAAGDEGLTFERDVRPIFKAYCLDCHGGGEELAGNLDLRLRRFAADGGDSGPAIVPGKPDESFLVERLKAGEMPPTEKKVPPDEIVLIERWIAAGAVTRGSEPQQLPPGIDITPEERAFWAFQPIQRPEPPPLVATVADDSTLAAHPDANTVRTPIDAFILAQLREHGLQFAPQADRLTLLRRAAFDLTGLPPSPEETELFLADQGPQAYEAMLDRLLASPHYGERWGRHWLDVAGYADSEGNGTEDTPRPYAYKYRDYVIRSLNADKPLDQFIIEQLAGDELVPLPWTNLAAEQVDTLAATGFLRMVVDGTASGGADEALAANQVLADALKIVGSSLLGLSVGCAQCHDHRYDPIPHSDYYRLRAVFEPAFDPAHWRRPGQRLVSLYSDADRAKAAAVDAEAQAMQAEYSAKQTRYLAAAFEKELLKAPEELRDKLREAYNTPRDQRNEEHKALLAAHPNVNLRAGVLYQYDEAAAKELKADQAKIAAKRAEKPVEDFVSVLSESPGVLPATHVFHRGDHRQPKQAVQPGDLTIAASEGERFEIEGKSADIATSGRRLAFARHLVGGRHPLVGRVLANRIWLHHFGHGIVETPGDFGVLGTRPSHPELLDWLADELVRQGWSLKRMHKLIMTSTVYRQSSLREPAAGAIDGDNRLYSRFPLRRLEAEAIRDRILAAGGQLDRTLFGPPMPVEIDPVGQVVVKDQAPRRSIYVEVRRTRPASFLAAFDAPVMSVNCERRVPSTSAPQSLMLMNGDFVLKQASLMAERVRAETAGSVDHVAESVDSAAASAAGSVDSAAGSVDGAAGSVASAAGSGDSSGATLARQVARAWSIAYQREPSPDELELASQFVAGQADRLRAAGRENPELAALANLCQQLFSSNEFLYVD